MTPAPLVSVVIPSYNRASCVARTIASAAAQTYPNLELIVVDDGSTDNTRELVEREFGHDPRVRYIHQENRGAPGARNTGFRAATGDYIALLDSDDTWEPWKLELQIALMEHFPDVGMTWTDMRAIDPDGRPVSPAYLRQMYSAWEQTNTDQLFDTHVDVASVPGAVTARFAGTMFHTGDVFSPMVMGNLAHTPTVVLRRERLERVKGFDESLRPAGEDYEFLLRVCREGRVGFLDLVTIEYEIGRADAVSRYSHAMASNFLKTVQRTLAQDARRITLTPAQIRFVLADANAWVGQEALQRGSRAEARRHFVASLLQRPLQTRLLRYLVLATAPPRMATAMRSLLVKFVAGA